MPTGFHLYEFWTMSQSYELTFKYNKKSGQADLNAYTLHSKSRFFRIFLDLQKIVQTTIFHISGTQLSD